MSKKTNAAKQDAKRIRSRRRKTNKPRKGRRPNPLYGKSLPPLRSTSSLLDDPIALHHVAGFILRALELYSPPIPGPLGMGDHPPDSFIRPAGIGDSCSACGQTKGGAFEQSMGMYCPNTADGIHRFEPLSSTVNSGSPEDKEPEKEQD